MRVSRDAQWVYLRLLPFADDYGRLPGDLFSLIGMVFPHDKIEEDELHGLLMELHDVRPKGTPGAKKGVGLVKYAENEVIEIYQFDITQKFNHRRADSLYPEYQSVTGKGKKRSEKGSSETDPPDLSRPFPTFPDLSQPALTYLNLTLRDRESMREEEKQKWADQFSVADAHQFFHHIQPSRASKHNLNHVTKLCYDYSVIEVIDSICLMGHYSWRSIDVLEKVLKGELPKKKKSDLTFDEDKVV